MKWPPAETAWPVTSVQYVFEVRGGTTPTTEDANWDGEVPWATPVDLRPVDGRTLMNTKRTISETGAASKGLTAAPVGSIIVSCRAPIGYVAVAGIATTTNQGCKSLVPAADVDTRFVAYQLLAARPALRARGTGTTFAEVSSQDVARFPLVLPSLEVQRRVADMLDVETGRIGALVAKNKQVITTLNARLWSAVESIVHGDESGDITPHPVWGQQPARWSTGNVGILFESMVDGPFGSSLTSAHYEDEGRQVVRLGNIGRAAFKNDDRAYISEDHYASLVAHDVGPGDLLVGGLGDESSDAPAGRACVVPDDFVPGIVKADCFRLRSTVLHHEYAAWALSSPSQLAYANAKARGATRPRLNLSIVSSLPMPVPPLGEQRLIASRLAETRSDTDRLTSMVERQIELLELRRRSLITAAVTGQITV